MNAQLSLTGPGLTREFLLAGKAVFTVVSGREGHARYTFRIKKKEFDEYVGAGDNHRLTHYFVQLLTGPENTHDYTYVGTLNPATGSVRLTGASRLTGESTAYRVADWACRLIIQEKPLPQGYELLPSSRCARCGRVLTVPESIKTGLGPECAGKI